MFLSEQWLTEIFISDDATYAVDLHKFVNNDKNILYVVGIPGSGKTTVAKRLAKKYNAIYVSLDDFLHEILDEVDEKELWNDWNSLEELELKYKKKILDEINIRIKDKKNKYVIEGIQIFIMNEGELPFKLIEDYPIIFLGTSYPKSTYRSMKRDLNHEKWRHKLSIIYRIVTNINRTLLYQKFREKRMNVKGAVIKTIKSGVN